MNAPIYNSSGWGEAPLGLGGDKSGQWNEWYRSAIPQADDLYDIHLQELHDEGLIDD